MGARIKPPTAQILFFARQAEGGCRSVSKGVEMGLKGFGVLRATTTTRRWLIIVVLRRIIGGGDDVGEITGRMAFHFVMVLVGLLEASIAAKREQDYFIALPIGVEAFVDGVGTSFCFLQLQITHVINFLLVYSLYLFYFLIDIFIFEMINKDWGIGML